jgi:DeoR/GlpR family transcriptional regulator of sugar metabolism
VGVDEIASRFGISRMTARRDLKALEDSGTIVRVHGGAMLRSGITRDVPYLSKVSSLPDDKARIAEAALELVSEGDAIILDAGSTTFALAKKLHTFKDLTVVTNDLKIAAELADSRGIKMICTGGEVQHSVYNMMGPVAERMVASLHVDTAFIGCDAVDPAGGVMTRNINKVPLKRAMISAASRPVVLADHSKFGLRVFAQVCSFDELAAIVTDDKTDATMLRAIEDLGVRVMRPGHSSQPGPMRDGATSG